MLKLPSIRSCLDLREQIGKFILYTVAYTATVTEHTFENIVEQQPIGHKLFLMFCEKDLQLSRCMQFLHAADELKIVVEGKRLAHAQTIFDDFVSSEVSNLLILHV